MNQTQCFWSGFRQNAYPFCEERLCSLITEPANTWTNVGYLVVAILMWKSKHHNPRIKKYFFWSTLSLFVGSTLFHATSTYWGKLLDVSAMFFLSVTILSMALERTYFWDKNKTFIFFIITLTFSLSFLYIMSFGNILFAFQILIAVWLEWKLLNRSKLKIAAATMVIAFTFWLLDVFKILCYSNNHILTGHGLWHLLAAFAIWTFFSAYKNAAHHQS